MMIEVLAISIIQRNTIIIKLKITIPFIQILENITHLHLLQPHFIIPDQDQEVVIIIPIIIHIRDHIQIIILIQDKIIIIEIIVHLIIVHPLVETLEILN